VRIGESEYGGTVPPVDDFSTGTAQTLFEAADGAAYVVKTRGKNGLHFDSG